LIINYIELFPEILVLSLEAPSRSELQDLIWRILESLEALISKNGSLRSSRI
jgi:hypothetical protein